MESKAPRYGNRPVVLIGCSGEGQELYRLASSLSSSLAGEVVSVIQQDKSANDGSSFVFAPEDMNQLILGRDDGDDTDTDAPLLSHEDVIVLDYAHELFGAEEGQFSKQLVGAHNDLARHLYSELHCLVIYVNVHPTAGTMGRIPMSIRDEFESSIFIEYSDYELALRDEGLELLDQSRWDDARWELTRIIARANLSRPVPGEDGTYTSLHSGATYSCNDANFMLSGKNTFFLSLSFPEIDMVQPYVADLCKDNDAMEFRSDLLDCRDDRHAILHSMFKLRSMTRPHATRAPGLPFYKTIIDDALPIVYTVRTARQAGTYPDETSEDIQRMFQLLRLGVRGASEVLDVESAWDAELTTSLLQDIEHRYSCLVLGSHHVVPHEVSVQDAVGFYQQCALDGRAHGAKVVLSIDDSSDNKDHMAMDAARIAQQLAAPTVIPAISLILGQTGVYSRILNTGFTPVTHEALPFIAAPGQLSSAEIMERRVQDGIVTKQKYAILGHNIAYSVSPQMQGAAFEATGLPHTYGRADVETIEEFIQGELWNDMESFGGCSVTIPHKQSIMPYVDVLSDAATQIGSVNTITAKYNNNDDDSTSEQRRTIYGDNTDWRGIYNPLQRKLKSSSVNNNSSTSSAAYALILGGGGTARAAAYAAQQLGLKRIYYNRTTQKAQDLADVFGGTVVTSLEEQTSSDDDTTTTTLGSALSNNNLSNLKVVISTLPATANFELPDWIVDQKHKTIVFDVNYKPYWTKLLRQAERHGCDVVRGSEMLWEQGVGQFEIWTGRTAPYKIMKTVVLDNCLPKEEQ